jgi:hypothetical protein
MLASGVQGYASKRARTDSDSSFSEAACTKTTHSFAPALDQIRGMFGGWLTHHSEGPEYCRRAHLERFLAACPLSSAPISHNPNFCWISVKRRTHNPRVSIQNDDISMEMQAVNEIRMLNEWNNLEKTLTKDEGEELGKQVLDIGRRHGCKSAKWMFFAGPRALDEFGRNKMDQAWNAIAKFVCLDAPERLTDSAKIATGADGKSARVICVYVDDFDDAERVEQLGNLVIETLKTIYPKGTISFKPDVYTNLRINAGNEWKIPPTLQTKSWPEKEEKEKGPQKKKEEKGPKKGPGPKKGKKPAQKMKGKEVKMKTTTNTRTRKPQRSIFS